ncbi:MAG: FMN-binding protein [Nitrospira sp.]|nr:FMN-binding protein [Nitrospira sp.]MBH0181108.1 FMN-binding protein [Nitrospira sp.]
MFACITLILGMTMGLIIPAVSRPAWAADRVWDNELRRHLTEEELNHAEVFMSEEDALKIMLPKSQRVRKEVLQLSQEKKDLIEQRIGWKFPENAFELYIGETGDKIDGYAMVHNTIGKHKHMTYMVGVDAKGVCSDVELLVFREAKGSEVGRKRFNSQYEGKTVSDPIRINKDIINITGATMSVRSISAGVKRVLVLVDEFYLKPAGIGSDTVAARKSDKGLFGTFLGN